MSNEITQTDTEEVNEKEKQTEEKVRPNVQRFIDFIETIVDTVYVKSFDEFRADIGCGNKYKNKYAIKSMLLDLIEKVNKQGIYHISDPYINYNTSTIGLAVRKVDICTEEVEQNGLIKTTIEYKLTYKGIFGKPVFTITRQLEILHKTFVDLQRKIDAQYQADLNSIWVRNKKRIKLTTKTINEDSPFKYITLREEQI